MPRSCLCDAWTIPHAEGPLRWGHYAGLCLQHLLYSQRPLSEQHLEHAGGESMSSLGLRRRKDGHTATDGLTKSGQEPTHRHFICKVTPQALLSAVSSAQPGVTKACVLLSGD